jgi:hypothetical protein
VEAAGEGHGQRQTFDVSIQRGSPGVLHGNRTYVLQDDNGQVTETHSISAGLDYPGVGPEHAFLHDIGRAEYVGITDTEALEAFHYLCRTEGIIPALESSHAVAYAMKLAKTMRPTSPFWSTCRDAVTRTLALWPTCLGPTSSADPVARDKSQRKCAGSPRLPEQIAIKVIEMSRIEVNFRCAQGQQGRKALIPFVMAGLPVCRRDAGPDARHGCRRGRHHRAGRSLFSDPVRRRPGDPEGGRQRPWPLALAPGRCWPW